MTLLQKARLNRKTAVNRVTRSTSRQEEPQVLFTSIRHARPQVKTEVGNINAAPRNFDPDRGMRLVA